MGTLKESNSLNIEDYFVGRNSLFYYVLNIRLLSDDTYESTTTSTSTVTPWGRGREGGRGRGREREVDLNNYD